MGKISDGILIISLVHFSQSTLGMEPSEKKDPNSFKKFLQFLALTPSSRERKQHSESHEASANVGKQNTPEPSPHQEINMLAKSESDPIHSPSKPKLLQFFSQGAKGMGDFQYEVILEAIQMKKIELAEAQMAKNHITKYEVICAALERGKPELAKKEIERHKISPMQLVLEALELNKSNIADKQMADNHITPLQAVIAALEHNRNQLADKQMIRYGITPMQVIFGAFKDKKPDLAEKQMIKNHLTPQKVFTKALRRLNFEGALCVINCKEAELEEMFLDLITVLKPFYKAKAEKEEEKRKALDKGDKKRVGEIQIEIDGLGAKQKPFRNLIRGILDRLETDQQNLEVAKVLKQAEENNMTDIVRAIDLVVKVGRGMKKTADANIKLLESDSDFRELYEQAMGIKMPQMMLKKSDDSFDSSRLSKSEASDSSDSRQLDKKKKKKKKDGQAS